jgi:hypothetical protein
MNRRTGKKTSPRTTAKASARRSPAHTGNKLASKSSFNRSAVLDVHSLIVVASASLDRTSGSSSTSNPVASSPRNRAAERTRLGVFSVLLKVLRGTLAHALASLDSVVRSTRLASLVALMVQMSSAGFASRNYSKFPVYGSRRTGTAALGYLIISVPVNIINF